jgi:hypothetical protein
MKTLECDIRFPQFIDSQVAFQNAIDNGFLSAEPTSPVYAGYYMYMYSDQKVNFFKHINTRKYISFIHI